MSKKDDEKQFNEWLKRLINQNPEIRKEKEAKMKDKSWRKFYRDKSHK